MTNDVTTNTSAFGTSPEVPSTADQASATTTTPVQTATLDPMAEWVGEGKKYASLEDAAKGLANANEHISNIEKENSTLREQATQAKTFEDVISSVSKQGQADQIEVTPHLDQASIEQIAKNTIENVNAEAIVKGNIAKVDAQLTELYGDKASEKVAERASELGISVTNLEAMAGQSPVAFFQLFGSSTTTTPNDIASSTGTLNTQALGLATGSRTPEGTYQWYQELRKDRGDQWYHSAAVQASIQKHAQALGRDKFFNK